MKSLYNILPYAITIIGAVALLPTYPVVSVIAFGMLAVAGIIHACAWYIKGHRS